MRNVAVLAPDGRAGSVTDVYFDDIRWCVRHLLVDTGHSMPQREVLVHPNAIALGNPAHEAVRVTLTRAEIEHCPDAGSDLPVTLQSGIADVSPRGDPHLRSTEVCIGYAIEALDGPFGHLEDLLADDRDWSIASLVVLSASWPGADRVLVPPQAVRAIDRPGRRIRLALARSQLRRQRVHSLHA